MKKAIGLVVAFWSVAVILAGCSLWEPALSQRMSVSEPVSRNYALETKSIMAGDVNIAYMEAGQGPWVLFLHGGIIPMSPQGSLAVNPLFDVPSLAIGYLPLAQSVMHSGALSTADTWNNNIVPLANAFHVVAPDLPGFGASDKPDIDYSMDDFITYLDAFMAAKGIDKAMIVGHGFGGELAIAYTLAHPEKVDRLVLVDSFGGYGLGSNHPRLKHSPLNLPRPVMKYWQKEKAAKVRFYLPLMRRMFGGWKAPVEGAVNMTVSQKIAHDADNKAKKLILSRDGGSGRFLDSLAQYKAAYITTEDARKEIQASHLALLETRRKDLAADLPEIKVPVLLIGGLYDPIVPPGDVNYMAAKLPRAQVIIYENSAHYPMIEEPEAFNRDVAYFLTGRDIASNTSK
ncbi:MAG TPA: alpha/beta hydrolase [bacterium]|nr:alpha/beta hydrolase [bacterium]